MLNKRIDILGGMNMELWKNCVEFPDYDVSDLGNVRNAKYGYLLSPGVHKDTGVLTVALYKDGKPHTKKVSRLVAETFFGKEQCIGLDVYHNDGNKSNNQLPNLLIGTRREAVRHGKNLRKNNKLNNIDI